jgi:hypothetical protein
VIAIGVVLAVGYFRFNETYDIDVSGIEIPTDDASVARGDHLVHSIAHCGFCHGDNFEGDYIINNPGKEGIVVAPNLTSGKGGIGGTFTDEDWVRAIYHGVNQEGRSVIIMPSLFFNNMSEDDLVSVIAYMKTIPPVDNELPETKPGPMLYALVGAGPLAKEMSARVVDHNAPFATAPAEGVTPDYGAYLISIGQCRACHSENLAGGQLNRSFPFAPNLTPGGDLANFSDEMFIKLVRFGKSDYMPFKYFANLNDDEFTAIWMYLQSQPALATNN